VDFICSCKLLNDHVWIILDDDSFSSKEGSVGRGLETELPPAVVLELSVRAVEGESKDEM
jgi:hypothetical protein